MKLNRKHLNRFSKIAADELISEAPDFYKEHNLTTQDIIDIGLAFGLSVAHQVKAKNEEHFDD